MDFDNFMFEGDEGYSRTGAYGRSKRAILLFTYEMDRRLKKANIDAIAVAAHPRGAKTNLGRNYWAVRLLYVLACLFMQSAAMGALPEIHAAVDPEVKGAEYYGLGGGVRGHPVIAKSSEASYNEEDSKKLWEISEELIGVKFSI